MGVVFRPVGILTGIIAGIVGKKIFKVVWRLIDDEDAPAAEYREIPLGKLVVALILEGAIFSVLRGLADHAAGQRACPSERFVRRGAGSSSQTTSSEAAR
jgi:hypothetical protein